MIKSVERIKLNERTLNSSFPIARQFSPQTIPPKTGVKMKLSKMAHIGFQSAGAEFVVLFSAISIKYPQNIGHSITGRLRLSYYWAVKPNQSRSNISKISTELEAWL